MKKLLGLLLLFLFGLSLVGCFNIYEDKSKRDMKLTEVKVFDKDNNEIVGTYKDYRLIEFPEDKEKLNSAAPVENFYIVKGTIGESYTVKFYFVSERNKVLTKLVFSSEMSYYSDTKYEVTDIVKEEGKYVATLRIENLSELNNFYCTISWFNKDKEITFSTKGSNTYIKGVYLELPSKEDTAWTI